MTDKIHFRFYLVVLTLNIVVVEENYLPRQEEM